MKYHSWYILSLLQQIINAPQEYIGRYIEAVGDVTADPIVIANVDDEVIFQRDFVAFYNRCKTLYNLIFFMKNDYKDGIIHRL